MKETLFNISRKMFTWKTIGEIFRYGLVTLVSYFFLVGAIWFLTHITGMGEKVAYAIALTINYVGVYIGYNKFVFKTMHNLGMAKRFTAVLICSWFANNLFFAIWLDIFSISYPLAVILNTIVLGAFRFMAQKFYVRK